MKHLFSFLLISIFLFSCASDDNNNETVINPLEELNLLGTWGISSRSFNGITPLVILCCEFITLEDNTETTDLIGDFSYIGDGIESEQIFEVNVSENTITFTNDDGDQLVMSYAISTNNLRLQYTDNDVLIEENWTRQ